MQLILAARRGEIEEVNRLLSAGLDPGARTSIGRTALHDAAREGHAEVVLALLNAGADVNARAPEESDFGYTYPLCDAIDKHHWHIVELLLARGADPEPPRCTFPPFQWAVHEGSLLPAKLLLAHGADVNGQSAGGYYSALHYAIEQQNWEAFRFLVENGARTDRGAHITSKTELETPLELAARLGLEDYVSAMRY